MVVRQGRMYQRGRSDHLLQHRCRVDGMAALLDDGIEPVDLVGRVRHLADGTVRLGEGVATVHDTVRERFFRVLRVAGVRVRHAVAEAVVRVRIVRFHVLEDRCGRYGDGWRV